MAKMCALLKTANIFSVVCFSPAFQEVSNTAIWCHFITYSIRVDLLKK